MSPCHCHCRSRRLEDEKEEEEVRNNYDDDNDTQSLQSTLTKLSISTTFSPFYSTSFTRSSPIFENSSNCQNNGCCSNRKCCSHSTAKSSFTSKSNSPWSSIIRKPPSSCSSLLYSSSLLAIFYYVIIVHILIFYSGIFFTTPTVFGKDVDTNHRLHSIDVPPHQNDHVVFTNQFVVEIDGGPQIAKRFADLHGFDYLGPVFGDHYHLRHRRVSKRSLDPHYEAILPSTFTVHSLKQQTLKSRVKRDFVKMSPSSQSSSTSLTRTSSDQIVNPHRFDDPRWPQMWYLNRGQGIDMNVQSVWDKNITGRGVVVTILDDGLEKNHPDLVNNYDPDASYDVNNQDGDPMPRYDMIDSNRHGTRCAGENAADANNSICAVGVAFGAKVGGVRMLDGDVTDAVEARSLSLNPQHIQIYSASWGPDDDGRTVDGPGEYATRAFIDGVTKGRNGLGSIFVWASGNGGREHDNCNCDGYTNSIWTLSISSATENGLVPWYSEACSSTLATTYSSGSFGERQIVTTDLHHGCTSSHTGTSASAPLAAGICALVLEANRNLTWRDMQHIVVQTAHMGNLHARDWKTNGVGRNVSHSFGYGLLDADAMVEFAKEWVTVPPQKICEVESQPIDKLIPAKSHVEMFLHVNCDNVRFLEHVQAKVTLTATRRGDIHIYLTSPSGTRSTLLAQRPMDNSRSGFQKWPFMTVHNWGENPNGEWKLEVHNEGRYYSRAYLKEWSLILYGTTINPDRRKRKSKPVSNNNNPNRTPISTKIKNVRPPPPTSSFVSPPSSRRDPIVVSVPSLKDNPLVNTIDFDEHRIPHRIEHADFPPLVHGTRAQKQSEDNDMNRLQAISSATATNSSSGCRIASGADCLGCQPGYFLLRNRCVSECPSGYFIDVEHRSSCLKCHYACRECNSSFNCTSCYNDSELHRNGRCYAKELVEEVVDLERWYTVVSVIFLVLSLVILSLVIYIITDKNPQLFSTCRHRSHSTTHHHHRTLTAFSLRNEHLLRTASSEEEHCTTTSSLVAVEVNKMIPLKSSLNYSDDYHSEDD